MRHDYEEAREAASIGIQKFPWYPSSYRWKAIALAQLGQVDAAEAALGKFLELSPRFDVSYAKQALLEGLLGCPFLANSGHPDRVPALWFLSRSQFVQPELSRHRHRFRGSERYSQA